MKSATFPVTCDEPMLGEWQRPFLVDLDERKDRSIVSHVSGG